MVSSRVRLQLPLAQGENGKVKSILNMKEEMERGKEGKREYEKGATKERGGDSAC